MRIAEASRRPEATPVNFPRVSIENLLAKRVGVNPGIAEAAIMTSDISIISMTEY